MSAPGRIRAQINSPPMGMPAIRRPTEQAGARTPDAGGSTSQKDEAGGPEAQQENAGQQDGAREEDGELHCMHTHDAPYESNVLDACSTMMRCIERHVMAPAIARLDEEEQTLRRLEARLVHLRRDEHVAAEEVQTRIMRVSNVLRKARATMAVNNSLSNRTNHDDPHDDDEDRD